MMLLAHWKPIVRLLMEYDYLCASSIGFVNGVGTSTTPQDYVFSDYDLNKEREYY